MSEAAANAPEEAPDQIAATAPLVAIKNVFRVRSHPGGTYSVSAEVEIAGTAQHMEVGVNATDDHPVVVALRTWLEAHPQTAIEAPATPTDEERRAALPNLTARQLRLGLLNAGIAPWQVQHVIEGLPPGTHREKALVEWEFASSFARMHPLISFVGGQLNLSDERIDLMWAAAATL